MVVRSRQPLRGHPTCNLGVWYGMENDGLHRRRGGKWAPQGGYSVPDGAKLASTPIRLDILIAPCYAAEVWDCTRPE